jgi:hypothetical protein
MPGEFICSRWWGRPDGAGRCSRGRDDATDLEK